MKLKTLIDDIYFEVGDPKKEKYNLNLILFLLNEASYSFFNYISILSKKKEIETIIDYSQIINTSDSTVNLDNKNIIAGSVDISGYDFGTDYTVDYDNGILYIINTDMLNQDLTVTYQYLLPSYVNNEDTIYLPLDFLYLDKLYINDEEISSDYYAVYGKRLILVDKTFDPTIDKVEIEYKYFPMFDITDYENDIDISDSLIPIEFLKTLVAYVKYKIFYTTDNQKYQLAYQEFQMGIREARKIESKRYYKEMYFKNE